MIPNEKLEELREDMEEDDDKLMVSYLKRDGETGDIELFVQVSEEIESFFETEETEESESWHNSDYHEYYLKRYNNGFVEFTADRMDSYGSEYITDGGEVNIGILRTQGISDGRVFKIDNNYSEETLEESVRDLKDVVKTLYREFISDVAIRGDLTIRGI